MRVTEITHSGRGWSPLVLHPRLSVISGEASQLEDVAEVLGTLYSSAGSVVGGTIEYSGFSMPLDQTAVVSLDIQGSGLRTLDPDLLDKARAEMQSELVAGVDSRLAELDLSTSRLDAEAETLRRKCAAADAAMAAVTDELRQSRQRVDELAERHDLATRRPVELQAEIDAAAVAAERAGRSLADAEALTPMLLDALDVVGDHVTALRLGGESPELISAVASAEEARLLDETHAASLNGWLSEVSAGTAEPSHQITAMISEIEHLEERWEDLSARGVEGEPQVIEARERYEEVSVRSENLEALASSGLLAERARSEIDLAHESADPSEEHRVLQLYGFDSYLDYTIALSTRSVGDAIAATVERTRAELVRATDALEVAREQAAAARGELNERREDLRGRINAVTGVEPESLSAELLATIPQLPQELLDLPALFDAALEVLRAELQTCRGSLAGLRDQLHGLDDPEGLRCELEDQRARVGELEELLIRAEEVHERSGASLGETETELQKLMTERDELMTEISAVQATGDELTTTEIAMVIRAATGQLVVPDAEPTPVLLVDSFSGFGSSAPDVLEAVVANAPGVQVVYLTGDDAVVGWAKKLTAETGRHLRVGRRSWLGRRLARPQPRRAHDSDRTL